MVPCIIIKRPAFWFLKLLLLKPPKTGTSADSFGGPALVLHGIYIRGKANGAIFDGLATRNHTRWVRLKRPLAPPKMVIFTLRMLQPSF